MRVLTAILFSILFLILFALPDDAKSAEEGDIPIGEFETVSEPTKEREITLDFTNCESLLSVDEFKSIVPYPNELNVNSYALDPAKLNEPPFEKGCNITFQGLDGLSGFTMSVFVYDTVDYAIEKYEKEASNAKTLYDPIRGVSGKGPSFKNTSMEVNDDGVGSIVMYYWHNYFLYSKTTITEGIEPLVVHDDTRSLSSLVLGKISTYHDERGTSSVSNLCPQLLSAYEVSTAIGYTDKISIKYVTYDSVQRNLIESERFCKISFQPSAPFIGDLIVTVSKFNSAYAANEKFILSQKSAIKSDGKFNGGSSEKGWIFYEKILHDLQTIQLVSQKNEFILTFSAPFSEDTKPLADLSQLREVAKIVWDEMNSDKTQERCDGLLSVDEVETAIGHTGGLLIDFYPGFQTRLCSVTFSELISGSDVLNGWIPNVLIVEVSVFDSVDHAIEKYNIFKNPTKGSVLEINESETGWSSFSLENEVIPGSGAPKLIMTGSQKDSYSFTVGITQSEDKIPLADLSQLREVTKIVWDKLDRGIYTVSEPTKERVPGWFKNSAKWWSEGKIGDSDFVNGIQFMIKHKIINIPNLPEQTSETAEEIFPDLIRKVAGSWADGYILEENFESVIKWLVKNGIIKV